MTALIFHDGTRMPFSSITTSLDCYVCHKATFQSVSTNDDFFVLLRSEPLALWEPKAKFSRSGDFDTIRKLPIIKQFATREGVIDVEYDL